MYLIGLDIGTTGCKAAVFDETGALAASASREYGVSMPQPGWAEQDAEAVWRLAQETLREVAASYPEIAAVGLSVQGEAVIPVDAAGQALRPAILGMDTRTGPQNAWLRSQFGAGALEELTGMPIHTINTLPKLLWLRGHDPSLLGHEPEIWKRADRFLLYEDFLIRKMTGASIISACLASRTQLYELRAGAWSEEILGVLGLDPGRLAQVKPSGYGVGPMHRALSAELGFARPPLVVTGGHDQACGALGVGLTEPGLAMVSTGTAEVVEVAMGAGPSRLGRTPSLLGHTPSLLGQVLTTALYEGNISVYVHTAPDLYLAMTLNHSGGLLLRWYRDVFGQAEIAAARQRGVDAYDLLLAEAGPAPTSLLLLPHFAGSGTPTFDTASKGAILGLTFSSTKAEVAKAILEGLTFELRVNLDLLKAGGVPISELRAIGGGARSDLWLQLKADITGIPVVAPRVTDAACWGAALLAGYGAGCFSSIRDAASAAVKLERRYTPDPERAAAYAARYALYRELYPTLKDLLHRM